jgi:hypothetical protein
VSDADLLAQAVVLGLLDELVTQAGQHYSLPPRWQPLLDGVRLWQLWNTDLPLAVWRVPVVQWLYANAPATGLDGSTRPLRWGFEFCRVHRLWMASPVEVEIEIPLACSGRDGPDWALPVFYRPPWRLAQLVRPRSEWESFTLEASSRGGMDGQLYDGEAVGLATVLEYAAATYGRTQVPVLLAHASTYDSLAALVPAVFGVSAEAFETGWHAYLAETYLAGETFSPADGTGDPTPRPTPRPSPAPGPTPVPTPARLPTPAGG